MSIAIDSLKHVPFSDQKCPRCVSYPSLKATPIKTSWAVKNNNTVHPPETPKSRKNLKHVNTLHHWEGFKECSGPREDMMD